MNVIILAAGFGRRLQELTENTPKPLIEVRGRPLIHYHLEKVLSLGPDRIVINTHFLADKLEDNITQNFPCLLYTSPSPRDLSTSRMPSSA